MKTAVCLNSLNNSVMVKACFFFSPRLTQKFKVSRLAPRSSMYGHINAMAAEVKAGIEEAGCECVMVRCPETLPADVLEKM